MCYFANVFPPYNYTTNIVCRVCEVLSREATWLKIARAFRIVRWQDNEYTHWFGQVGHPHNAERHAPALGAYTDSPIDASPNAKNNLRDGTGHEHMKHHLITAACLCYIAMLAFTTPSPADATNLAASGTATASSQYNDKYTATKAIDGKVDDNARWLSADGAGPHWLTITLPANLKLGSAHVHMGYSNQNGAIANFQLQQWDGQRWRTIAGTTVAHNNQLKLRLVFDRPIETTRVRLYSEDAGPIRVKELLLFAPTENGSPKLGVGVKDLAQAQAVDTSRHVVLVNQAGYNRDWPKRFTAPISPGHSVFVISAKGSDRGLYYGEIEGGVGDFSDFKPEARDTDYVIQVTGHARAVGRSYPFKIEPLYVQRLSLEPALRFMIDSRSVIGTHNSAYGGCPWRDGTYYTYELPSIVMLYMANPAFFEHAPIEIDYQAERKRVLDPNFKLVKAHHDAGALDTARQYYTDIDPPVGDRVPDYAQLLHWGIGYYLCKPASHDPSGDKLGNMIHGQTVEQFAYFLYAYPHYKQYFTDRFYKRARAFAVDHWQSSGLFDVIKTVGTPKGRHCPGHSIAPNLMMHAVAKRDGLPNAGRYLQAAVNQARWVVTALDPADPRVTKGQRMSEHMLITGLFMLKRHHPDRAPKQLDAWLDKWTETVLSRSGNMYDFRQYDAEHMTLPKPWNEPGNIAAFPGIVVAAKAINQTAADAPRLDELKASHFDNLFGRNPMNAASANRAVTDYPGVEVGWPKHYHKDVCARLELVRGTISSNAATEHYPLNPSAGFRHPEGWTAFNAAFNVGLAYTTWDDTRLWLTDKNGQPVQRVATNDAIVLRLRFPYDLSAKNRVTVVTRTGRSTGRVQLAADAKNPHHFVIATTPKKLGATAGSDVVISYGHGLFERTLTLRHDSTAGAWKVIEG